MKTLTGVVLLFSFVSQGFTQGIIQGKVHDAQAKEMSFANVLLWNKPDSSMVKGVVSDESGNYIFTEIPKGEYYVEVHILGYAKTHSPVFSFLGTEKNNLATIILVQEDQNLEEVTVVATRPFFELEQGKMVVNVANSISAAGLSVIDVLDRSPGVMVNRQSNSLSVLGKNGVVILMNGHRFRMPMEAAYQMLAGLNSSDVEKIEIITVPPANYDADGDAGFINIVMKKDNDMIGTNGILTIGQGYGSGYNGNMSFSLNHQGPKFSWFGILSATYVDQVQEWEAFRGNNNGFEDISIETTTDRFATRKAINYQAGFDYKLTTNTILSGLVSGYNNRWDMTAPNVTKSNYSISPDTLFRMTTVEINKWSHIMGNINLQHTFQNGQVISTNVDYLTYKNSNPSWYTIMNYDESDDLIGSQEFRVSKDTPIDLWVTDLNHSMKMGKSVSVESGLRATFSKFTNTVVFEEKLGSDWLIDPKFTNDGLLNEDILAAFSTAKIDFDEKTTLNAGVRYENTKTNLTTVSGEKIVDRHYGDFFPTAFLSRKINADNLVQVSYGRRITRPTFNQMAPFVFFSDPFSFFAGNENILPTYTNTFKTDYSYKSMLFFVQYSRDKNVIASFQPTLDEESNTVFLRTENLDQRQTVAMMVAFPLKITSWWETQNNFTANYQRVNSELNGEIYEVDQKGIQVVLTNTFTLPKKYTIELMGNYNSPTINGYFNWLSRGFVNLGIQKDFEKSGVLRISCNDIFETSQLRWRSFEGADLEFSGRLKFEKRVFMATYTYKFGNNKIQGTRKRKVGSQEEQRRVTN
ncbi:Outer membrane receptor proteins, mostly Fe transport [Aquiflexum balticum DSM 16537]|uniref:Outer membrane receptor proteins, mostly Fe transport n=1 Tax=Aquiflexum balticum DSM 16537 TaxID=758820 RepID=A0A1W2H0U0_9BACT|nr:outer membrane beta-barrel family protein [Aquiflexum balticum]SMD42248.1 Outer membrane receptor proteins, mostly Fe transport [Aquiflexum balticum DSM 16537]